MRKYLFLLMALAAYTANADTLSYFSCDFEDGMPQEFSLFDEDGGNLHFTMVQLGFDDTDSWEVLRENGTDNHYAASASRFKKAKGEEGASAEDWMVTPPIWIRGADATLTWRAMSVNERNSSTSTYKILVSEAGPEPEGFTGEPLAVVEGESLNEWASHSLSLSDYVGKRICIAFVNISTDSDVLAVDDISVAGSSGVAALDIIPGEYTIGKEEISFGGILTATSEDMVNTLSVTFEVGEKTFHAEYDNLELASGETFEFTLPEKVAAEYGETIDFRVNAEVNGIRYDELSLHTTLLAFLPHKRVVIEESTGMWCGYCPKGIVALHTLQENYPDSFIGIAVHVNDDMTVWGYGDLLPFPAGAPSAWIDRKGYCEDVMIPVTVEGQHIYTTLRGGLESMMLERLEEQAFADVDVATDYDETTGDMKVNVSTRFAMRYNDRDFRVVVAMTEDNVWKAGYYQTNYFSGRGEILDGFEVLPPMIFDDFSFQHVARGVLGDYLGIEGSLPSDIEAGAEYTYSADWTLPKSVISADEVKIIAMVADAATGEIMNANSTALSLSGVEKPTMDTDSVTVRIEGSGLIVAADGELTATVFGCNGVKVAASSGYRQVSVDRLPKGIYVVRVTTATGNKTVKVSI